MAIQTTRWSPDTCACVHEYQWDDSVPADQRVHTAGNVINQCVFHTGLSAAAHFAKLQDENPRKNNIVGTILAQVASLTLDDITWSFDGNRVLDISCPKLTTPQKNTLQTAANTRFGTGKVLFL